MTDLQQPFACATTTTLGASARLGRRRLLAVLLAGGLVVSACAANPGPPPVESGGEDRSDVGAANEAAVSSEERAPEALRQVSIGIDPLTGGLNPHLLSDDSEFVRALADLVLPSVFHREEINSDLVLSAHLVEPPSGTAQTIRYDLRPEAQWSDGTPITVADFDYLRKGIAETPGALEASQYREIAGIRSANGGRTVYVDLDHPVQHWQGLFSHLLPSHLLESGSDSFAGALSAGIPASAGRYTLQNVDRSRGIITVVRNDRYWGSEPANNETIRFVEVRDLLQASELLRSGQVQFLDITPGEVTSEALALIPNTQQRTEVSGRRLELVANSALTRAQRESLQSMVNSEQLARIALGRSRDLGAAQSKRKPDPAALLKLDRPVRIGVDPNFPGALAAARAFIDVLRDEGVDAREVSTDTQTLLGARLPNERVDAIIAWTAASNLDRYHCDEATVASNLANWCDPELQEASQRRLAGTLDQAAFDKLVRALEGKEHLTTQIAGDVRLQVLGRGIVGPDSELDSWPPGLSTVADWTTTEE